MLIKLIKNTYRMARAEERRVVMGNFVSLSVLQAITYLFSGYYYPLSL